MTLKSLIFAAAGAAMMISPAFAQSEVTEDKLFDHFFGKDSEEGASVDKGGTRGLAIGGPKKKTQPAATTTTTRTDPAPKPKKAAATQVTPKPKKKAAKTGAAKVAKSSDPFDLLITFELGSSRLTKRARKNLDAFAKFMGDERAKSARFEIEGHTDARGAAAFNQSLSEERAAAVINYLSRKGADTSRLVARGYGESRPRVSNAYAAVNRRVEATLLSR